MKQFSFQEFQLKNSVQIHLCKMELAPGAISRFSNIQQKDLEQEMKLLLFDKLSINDKKITKDQACYFLECQNLYMSISHKFPIVAIAIHKTRVGVDLEKISDQTLRVLPKILTPKEKEMLKESQIDASLSSFIWSCKEALYKISKENRYSFRENYEVSDIESDSATGKIISEGKIYPLTAKKIGDYWLVVASE